MSKFTHMLLAILPLIISLSKVAAETLSTGEDVRDYVLRKITEADVMVFAKSYCPHCNAARTLLDELNEDGKNGWSLDVVDLDLMDEDDGPTIQMELLVS
jgi:thiol-disulfide isomerase/thioredoxin